MKTSYAIVLAFCLLFSACGIVQPTYFGDKFPPTTKVEIFYSTHDVKKEYKVIGHMNLPNLGQETVKDKFMAYAKSIGADAIVITGNTIDVGGKFNSDVVNADALKYN